uniref:Uncharacterized protein n=1 Tax=Siphoviridae sp. ctZHD14 TaxID=2827891 RepID=A0A8S5SW17_9CAUD|nr:MAG TPA: hypothetical protein [Siphoviridae sp. ctZHD14]
MKNYSASIPSPSSTGYHDYHYIAIYIRSNCYRTYICLTCI